MIDLLVRAGLTVFVVVVLFAAVAAFHRNRDASAGLSMDTNLGLRGQVIGFFRPVAQLREWLFWCALVLLLVLLFTDMPNFVGSDTKSGWGQLSDLWSSHSVWSGLLASLATLGVAYFLWRHNQDLAAKEEEARQADLAATVSAAGLAGIVDHVVDAELLLALVSLPTASLALLGLPGHADGVVLDKDSLRRFREAQPQGSVDDVRLVSPENGDLTPAVWRANLVDLAVRRLAKAMNQWSPLISRSTYGEAALYHLAMVRIDLVALHSALVPDRQISAEQQLTSVISLRGRLRFFALFFEYASGVTTARSEVLREPAEQWLHATESAPPGFELLKHFPAPADAEWKAFHGKWAEAWSSASGELGFEAWRITSRPPAGERHSAAQTSTGSSTRSPA